MVGTKRTPSHFVSVLKLQDVLSSSKVETEATAGKIVKADAIPVLEKLRKVNSKSLWIHPMHFLLFVYL